MNLILWILALVLIVAGALALFRRQLLWGIVLIVVGLLIGPGTNIFNT
jgi:membrane-bound ClpP family serine protease